MNDVCAPARVRAQPVVDFPGYNDVVAHALAEENIGGSDACLAAVEAAFARAGERLPPP